MSILDKINCSNDIKKLNSAELIPLCNEIRRFLIDNVSKTGGHLASNLGAVELTVALHRVYDSSKDRIIFDVGHQSYTHKIITGRRGEFSTLRQYKGLSGFPKPYESEDDAFIAGHASSSVSTALGMAKARSIRKDNYDVVAVIGDGAATGGLALEGIENAAACGEPLVIILNDNKMSISENVGGFAKLLQRMRVRPAYLNFKQKYRVVMSRAPMLYELSHNVKEHIKARIIHDNVFSEMGFHYMGPIDGHDVELLEQCIRWARDTKKPVLLHVLTIKGKGYKPAEEHPDVFHGVGPFDALTGEVKPSGKDYSAVFGETLCELAAKNSDICAITAAMADGTGLHKFAEEFPKRFFDVGICEGHAVSMAGGMAKQGLIPVFAVYSSFLQRGYDMLIQDISLLKLHAVFAVDRAGLVGNDGETHHGVFDLGFLRSVPGMTVLCPASFRELSAMLELAVNELTGPVAVRYSRGGEGEYKGLSIEAECILREGEDVTLVGYGQHINEIIKAAELLREKGISAEVIKLGRIMPEAYDKTMASVKKTGRIIVAEETAELGCVGRSIMSRFALLGFAPKSSALINLKDGIVKHGAVQQLYRDLGLDAETIALRAEKLVRGDR